MDNTFEKYKKKVYVEKTYINEELKKYNKSINIAVVFVVLFFSITGLIFAIEERWRFSKAFFVIVPIIGFTVALFILIKRYSDSKKSLNKYHEKLSVLHKEFEKTINEEEKADKTYLEIRQSDEYRDVVKKFFTDATVTDSYVYLNNKAILLSFISVLLCVAVLFGFLTSRSFSPERWEKFPVRRSYMLEDLKNRLDQTILSDKYNLYSLSDEEIEELFYVEGMAIPQLDFKFYSDYETYNAYYMYTENSVNYWVICIHQGHFRSIDFVKTGDVYQGILGQNIDEPDVPLEDRTPLLPENFK